VNSQLQPLDYFGSGCRFNLALCFCKRRANGSAAGIYLDWCGSTLLWIFGFDRGATEKESNAVSSHRTPELFGPGGVLNWNKDTANRTPPDAWKGVNLLLG
jgi:hypothetical protein